MPCTYLLLGDLDVASLDGIGDVLGALAVNLAAGGESGTEDLLNGTLQVLGHGLEAHGAGNVDDLIKRNALGVLDVLLLLAVSGRLLEGLDDKGRSGGDNGDGGLTVLDGKLDRYPETLPSTGGLGDIFTDLYEFVRPVFWLCVLQSAGNVLLGERPRGPILGASADEAPTSPPVARR